MLVAAAAVAVGAVATVAVTGNDEPESAVVTLAGTELEPDAAGRASIAPMDSGFEIELDISGLPPAPVGTYYQGWLRNQDGDAVTIGTFHGREGTDDIILWSGVDIADYPTLTVTIQQERAGAESSGRSCCAVRSPAADVLGPARRPRPVVAVVDVLRVGSELVIGAHRSGSSGAS